MNRIPQNITSVLNQYLDPVLSSSRTAEEVTRGLSILSEKEQDFALHWTEIVSKYNPEMAYQFASKIPLSLKLMGTEGTLQWLLNAMDVYDKQGLYPGSAALDNIEKFAQKFRLNHVTVSLDKVKRVLETILRGLTGRDLKVESGNSTFTDTETVYLPAAINRFNDAQKNYQLYKVMAVHLWAQTWFGTFKRATPDSPHLTELLSQFDDPTRATHLFNLLETFRLNACIQRHLPGLASEIIDLHGVQQIDQTWKGCIDKLESDNATVADTLNLTQQLYDLQLPWPEPFIYQGKLNLNKAQTAIEQRNEKNRQEVKTSIEELIQQMMQKKQKDEKDNDTIKQESMDISTGKNEDDEICLQANGENVSIPAEMLSNLESMMQDFEQIPEEWLMPDNQGYTSQDQETNKDTNKDNELESPTFLYDEWDYRRQIYRKNWCSLKELTPHPIHDDFVGKTLKRYANLVNEIRKHFETLRGENTHLRAQNSGDEVDIDALIHAKAEVLAGREMSDRIYIQRRKVERDLAVMLMIDASGSTKGWINKAERESLVLLCQALEILGDQYAIYGFSGMTRNRCEVYTIKTFDMPYNDEIRARISGLRPQDYTRMGVAIRHLSNLLNTVEAQTRVLITLSDGKPDDYDGYKGDYGIEDTRQALLEARHSGIHPFCITIDTQAGDYLSHMYGQSNYAVVDDVKKLPLKVADIYRNLTT